MANCLVYCINDQQLASYYFISFHWRIIKNIPGGAILRKTDLNQINSSNRVHGKMEKKCPHLYNITISLKSSENTSSHGQILVLEHSIRNIIILCFLCIIQFKTMYSLVKEPFHLYWSEKKFF